MSESRVCLIAAALLLACGCGRSRAADMSADFTALVHDVLLPYSGETSRASAGSTVRATETLEKDHLLGLNRPTTVSNGLIEQYARALALGTRGATFATEIVAIHDSFQRGDTKGVEDAIRTLSQHAGRKPAEGEALNQMVSDLQKIEGGGNPVERVTIEQPDHSTEVTWFKGTGKVKIDVVDKGGSESKPTRTVFEGNASMHADSTGKFLELTGKPGPEPPRRVTEESSKALREKLNGRWMDRDGHEWDIAGTGDLVTLAETYSNGHKVVYDSDYTLAKITGTHIIDDPADVTEGFPEEIKQQLASNYHPPYKISLDANDAGDCLEGRWTSMHVTYSSLDLSISKVGDPYDLPLVLTRGYGTALGMRDKDIP